MNYKYEIGTNITSNGRNLIIIDREIREKHFKTLLNPVYKKYYKYKCNVCGNEDWMEENNLSWLQTGCNVCAGQKVLPGVNDVATTAKWLADLFVNQEETTKCTNNSKHRVDMKCPDCGKIHNKTVGEVYRQGLSCICGDSWSYPNKFMYALLKQFDVEFETEKSFDWSDNRKYDDVIWHNGLLIITEQHGAQHYIKSINDKSRTLEEEQENDIYKRKLALTNGADCYFEIDCAKSELEYIKKSIVKSGLLELLNIDVNSVDWAKCEEFALSNLCKKVCTYKTDNPNLTLHQIADDLCLGYRQVLRFVKKGSKIGWCSYSPKEDVGKSISQNLQPNGKKPIFCITNSTYYDSAQLAAKMLSTDEVKFNPKPIKVSIHKDRDYKGYRFQFITQEQFNKIKSESPALAHGDFFIL